MPCEFDSEQECRQDYVVHKMICAECKRSVGDIVLDELLQALDRHPDGLDAYTKWVMQEARAYLALFPRMEISNGVLIRQPTMREMREFRAEMVKEKAQ